ncbi:MAG: aldehyde dehydrogenase family protein, partial [Rhodobacteraceae bacterium]|nr:aldehyde dehydrogenase family protein [Paracoccaceae bacterium]
MRDSGLLPHPDAEACLGAINAIAAAESLEAVWRLTVTAFNRYGFERINYGYTRYRTGLGIGDPLDAKTQIGPVVDQGQLDQNLEYLALAATEGCDVRGGGLGNGNGFFGSAHEV